MNMNNDNQSMGAALHHLGHAMIIIGDALKGMESIQKVEKQTPAPSSTTAKAKAKADKEAQTASEPETQPEEKVETKAEEKAKAKQKKKDEPKFDFEAAGRDEQVEFLRGQMVKVSAQLQGDRTKVFAFLKKYNANKVNELSDENLVNLHTDIQVFLAGPDALDV